MKIKKAVVLCAGYGKRLNPITLSIPKPLIKINNKTLLERTIRVLEKYGIEEIVINTHHLSEKINYFLSENNFNLKISIKKEKEKILETGGGVMNAAAFFKNEPYFILNPDTIWNDDYLKDFQLMEKKFYEQKCKHVLLLVNKKNSFDKNFIGDFNIKDFKISKFDNKDKNYIFIGAQITSNLIFKNIKKIEPFSINEIWNDLIKNQELFGVVSEKSFYHLTNLDVYNSLKDIELKICGTKS